MRSIRKQAGPVSEATPGTVLNTLVNPAAYFYGDYWVPEFMLGKSTPNGRETITSPFPTKDPNVNAFMFHTAAIGTTAAAIAAAAVLMRRLSYGEKERRKREEMVSNRAQVDAPVFAAGATPEKEQHKLDEAGIDKQASSAMVPPLSVILPIAALAVGGTLGHRGMSVYLDKQHEAELDDDLDKTRAELEQQQYEALMKARGAKQVGVIPKQGADDKTMLQSVSDGVANLWQHSPTDFSKPDRSSTAPQKLGALAGLLLASVYVTSAVGAKHAFDASDPARKQEDDLKAAVDELSKARYRDQPIDIHLANPAAVKKIDRQAAGGDKQLSGITPHESVSA